MKMLIAPLLVAVLIACPAYADGSGKHLFILSGQSNMGGLDPDLSFTPTVQEALGQDSVIVVKDAHAGNPIRRWYKKWKPASGEEPKDKEKLGIHYDKLMKKVRAAVEGETITTVTFVWMQGERDAKEGHGEVYAKSMRGLIDQLTSDMDRENINFVIGRLSDFDMNNAKYPHWTMVREAQVKVAESDVRGAWVNTDDLNDGINKKGKEIQDDLHYAAEGYKILGKRFADAALRILKP